MVKKEEKISQDDLERFIADLDKNPRCKNKKCCDGEGICITLEDFEKKHKI